jgi:hypothetical protein
MQKANSETGRSERLSNKTEEELPMSDF